MSDNKRESYPSEFKESAVKLAIESKHPIAQTARELGISPILFMAGLASIQSLMARLLVQMNTSMMRTGA